MELLVRKQADFIDDGYLRGLLEGKPDHERFVDVLAKSRDKQALSASECAVLLNATDPDQVAMLFQTARDLKRSIYGNRIVLFAPLYIGNYCKNDCSYCGFRRSNTRAVRRTLSHDEIVRQVTALEDAGHKRLILVFGEHAKYNAEFIAEAVGAVYGTKSGRGSIRRVNINAPHSASMTTESSRLPASAPTRFSRRRMTSNATAPSTPRAPGRPIISGV